MPQRGAQNWPIGTLRGDLDRTVGDVFREAACAGIEIGIQILMVVVLHAVMLVAQSVVNREPGSQLKAVACIQCPVLIAIAARDVGRLASGGVTEQDRV